MNRKIFLYAVLMFGTVLAGCKGETKPSETPAEQPANVEETGPVRQESHQIDGDIQVNGKTYHYDIVIASCDTMPTVKDESGKEYYDNSINLRITREDKSEFFNRNFTKHAFKNVFSKGFPANYISRSILRGMNFNYDKENDHSAFFFTASVDEPEVGGLECPIDITISTQGEVSYKQATSLDTAPQTEGLNIDPSDNLDI